jgi:antitoxin (DNA-binding transcriptional repressor) of toxin-antitoxin stability system
MEHVITCANLRRHPGELVSRASKGETFVVLRYGRAVAVLRPRLAGEAYEPLRTTDLWRDFRRVLGRARREALLITWYSDAMAVLGPVPTDWRRGAES